ncbi:MAG: EthD family reductase [Hyphomicrobiales bacterium]
MRFCYFVTFENVAPEARISSADKAGISALIAGTPHLCCADIHTPTVTRDIYTADGPSPQLALQLYFDELTELEEAIAANGHLQALAGPGAWPSLAGAKASHQAMYARHFPVADGGMTGRSRCSFLVQYPGEAENFNAWLSHYIASHPPIMRRFPGIRQIEILSRVDWIDAMPFERVQPMQRNRVVFDSPEALTAALQSPVRHEMRADYHKFPPFTGDSLHFPMITETIRGVAEPR